MDGYNGINFIFKLILRGRLLDNVVEDIWGNVSSILLFKFEGWAIFFTFFLSLVLFDLNHVFLLLLLAGHRFNCGVSIAVGFIFVEDAVVGDVVVAVEVGHHGCIVKAIVLVDEGVGLRGVTVGHFIVVGHIVEGIWVARIIISIFWGKHHWLFRMIKIMIISKIVNNIKRGTKPLTSIIKENLLSIRFIDYNQVFLDKFAY